MEKLAARLEHQEEVAPRTVPVPPRIPIEGTFVRLEPLNPDLHGAGLYRAGHQGEGAQAIWDYLPYGPFPDEPACRGWLTGAAGSLDPAFFAIRRLEDDRLSGMLSFLNIHAGDASIEIGHIWFAPFLQKTPAATEALFLVMAAAFDELGYRRLEWKCNACNEKSRAAALRLGFAFEGVFFRHMIVKGRNRDTAWFSLLDEEWPVVRACFETWLAPGNFDDKGRQKSSLGDLTRALRS